jgi:signal peptidase I
LAFAKAFLILAGTLVVCALVFGFAFLRAYRMPSSSMEPTFHCALPALGCRAKTEDRFVVLKLGGVGRGDVVAFETPAAARERCGAGGTYVKRVIGLPGERVTEADGYLSIDGQRLDEPYIPASGRDHEPKRTWRVPAGAYFLLGDNRAQSCDSRVFGAVPKSDVIGRVVFVYWPPSRLGFR